MSHNHLMLWLLFLFVLRADAKHTLSSGNLGAAIPRLQSLSIDTLSMSIDSVWMKSAPDNPACVLAGTLITNHEMYLVSASCGVNIKLSSGNVDLTTGSIRKSNMPAIECYEPTSDWKIRYVNKSPLCNMKYLVNVTWDCVNPASSISSKCMLRMNTTIPPLPSPIWVGDQVVATVDVLDSPALSQYPVVNVTTNFSYTAMPSIPAVLSTVSKHEINFTITSPGTHQICLDIEAKQYLELGTTCRNITVNDLTAIPPTVVPTVNPTAMPTEVPTVIPTVVPTVVPTEVPTAIPTEVPTAIPTVVPTAEPIPPTAVPNTTVPETEIPSTGIPTSIPTEVPILSTSEPSTSAPSPTPTHVPVAFGSTTAGGAAIGAVLAGSGAGGSLSKTMVIVNQMKCSDGLPTSELPLVVHPLMFAIEGNFWAGAVIGNVALCFAIYALFTILCYVAKSQKPNKDVKGLMRYPGVMIPPSLILYPSILQYGGGLIIHSSSSLKMKIIGVGGCTFCIILFVTVLIFFRCDHGKGQYRSVSSGNSSHSPLMIYVFGEGAWEDVVPGTHYIAKMGTSFDIYHDIMWLRGNYILIEYGQVPFLVAAAWISADGIVMCTVRISILFVIVFVQLVLVWKCNVYIAKLLFHLHIVTSCAIITALVLQLISIHGYGDDENLFDTCSTHLMTLSLSLVLLRAAYDVLQFMVDVISGYKRSLIQESHDEEDGVVSSKTTKRSMKTKPSFCEVNQSFASLERMLPTEMSEMSTFANMEYNLLHWEVSAPTENLAVEDFPWNSEVSL